MNEKGNSRMDFAGFHSTPALAITAAYAAVVIAALAVAHTFHEVQLKRRW